MTDQEYWIKHPKLAEYFSAYLNQMRKHSIMIVLTKEELEKVFNSDWIRADGRCICPECNEEYRKHPWLCEVPTFHLLCDGTWVKT